MKRTEKEEMGREKDVLVRVNSVAFNWNDKEITAIPKNIKKFISVPTNFSHRRQ